MALSVWIAVACGPTAQLTSAEPNADSKDLYLILHVAIQATSHYNRPMAISHDMRVIKLHTCSVSVVVPGTLP